eukprot:403348947
MIDKSISNGGVYQTPGRYLQSNYGNGTGYLMYDFHHMAYMKDFRRTLSIIFFGSLFADYYFYQIAFNKLYLGITGFVSFMTGLALANANFQRQMEVLEMVLMDNKESVMILTTKGDRMVVDIELLKFKEMRPNAILFTFQPAKSNMEFTGQITTPNPRVSPVVFDEEAIQAVLHPNVKRFA